MHSLPAHPLERKKVRQRGNAAMQLAVFEKRHSKASSPIRICTSLKIPDKEVIDSELDITVSNEPKGQGHILDYFPLYCNGSQLSSYMYVRCVHLLCSRYHVQSWVISPKSDLQGISTRLFPGCKKAAGKLRLKK